MRADIAVGVRFPDYELTDHTGKHRKLSDLQGPDPMILVLSRGGFCPKDRRQAKAWFNFIMKWKSVTPGSSRSAPTTCF
jgi:peroxiredoxin